MKRQRGQTLVEFALMAPMICLLVFGMIYGGAMFMQYLNFSNNARQIAREVSVLANYDKRKKIVEDYGAKTDFTLFYKATRKIYFKDKDDKNIIYNESGNLAYADDTENSGEESTPVAVDVIVEVDFTRNNGDLPWILYKVGFPPETINPIVYRMRLEQKASTE